MGKVVLLSILVATLAIPIWAARDARPRRGHLGALDAQRVQPRQYAGAVQQVPRHRHDAAVAPVLRIHLVAFVLGALPVAEAAM